MNLDLEKLDNYIDAMIKEKHKTCLTDEYDKGYFWAMKELQAFIRVNCTDEL